MTAAAPSAAAPSAGRRRGPAVATHPVTLRRALRAETIKFTTLRSTLAVLGGAVLGMLVIALVVAWNTRHLTPSVQAEDRVPSATLQGYYLGQLLVGALGVLFVTGEYGTGMIRSSLAAVPRRLPVLAAKAVVIGVVGLVSMVAVSVVAFLAAQALIGHYRTGWSLGDPGALRVVVGTGVYLALLGLLGSAIGWIVRSTPGALVTYIAVILVVPLLVGSVLGAAGKDVAQWFPTMAGASFSTSLRESPSLGPWTGLAVMAAWIAASLAVAAVVLRSRDA